MIGGLIIATLLYIRRMDSAKEMIMMNMGGAEFSLGLIVLVLLMFMNMLGLAGYSATPPL